MGTFVTMIGSGLSAKTAAAMSTSYTMLLTGGATGVPSLDTATPADLIGFFKDMAIAILDFPIEFIQWVYSNVYTATVFSAVVGFAFLMVGKKLIPGLR